MQLDGDGAADQLHALSQRPEALAEDGVPHAQHVERVRDAAAVAGAAEPLDALQVGDVQLADLSGPVEIGQPDLLRLC